MSDSDNENDEPIGGRERLNAILTKMQNARSEEEEKQSEEQKSVFVQKLGKFCMSYLGMAIIAFIVVFILLLVIRPQWVFKKTSNPSEARDWKNLSFITLVVVSFVAAVLIAVIPMIIIKSNEKTKSDTTTE